MIVLIFENILCILFSLVTFFLLNKVLAGLSFIVLCIPVFVPVIFKKLLENIFSQRMKIFENHLNKFNSFLESFELIKNYGIETQIQNKMKNSNRTLLDADINDVKANAVVVGMSFVTGSFASAVIVIISAYLVFSGKLSSGDFISILSITMILLRPLYWIANQIQTLISSKPIIHSVLEFIENKKNYDIQFEKNNKKTQEIDKNKIINIEFHSVSFSNSFRREK